MKMVIDTSLGIVFDYSCMSSLGIVWVIHSCIMSTCTHALCPHVLMVVYLTPHNNYVGIAIYSNTAGYG